MALDDGSPDQAPQYSVLWGPAMPASPATVRALGCPASVGKPLLTHPSGLWRPSHQAVTWSSQEMVITQGMWPVAIGPDPLEVSGEKPSALIQCCPGTTECLSLTSSLLHPDTPHTTCVPGWDSRGSLHRVAAFPSDQSQVPMPLPLDPHIGSTAINA